MEKNAMRTYVTNAKKCKHEYFFHNLPFLFCSTKRRFMATTIRIVRPSTHECIPVALIKIERAATLPYTTCKRDLIVGLRVYVLVKA